MINELRKKRVRAKEIEEVGNCDEGVNEERCEEGKDQGRMQENGVRAENKLS